MTSSPDKFLRGYFQFSRAESRGILILLIILITLVVVNLFLPRLFHPSFSPPESFAEEISKYEEAQKAYEDSLRQLATDTLPKPSVDHLKPFEFDPNNLPVEKWRELGLSEEQIRVIKKYEEKGGRFRTPDDLAKIYNLSQEEFQVLRPYIKIRQNQYRQPPEHKLTPFPFNPNKASRNELLSLGLAEHQVDNIINYREKGGIFFDSTDFNKLYTISPREARILAPWIRINQPEEPVKAEIPEPQLIVEINHADTLELQQLPGIGPSFARRIVKYRDLLGGYYDKKQLLEVYGLDSIRYRAIEPFIEIDSPKIRQININKATFDELIRHPYIEFYLAKSILEYRQQVGEIEQLDELTNARLVYDELYRKIAPYLTLKDSGL
ncbi:MAG: hypothetical protein Kow00127_10560 [Bacteroidales bacterium]